MSGQRHVFDAANFKVKNSEGQYVSITQYLADVDTDDAFTADTQVILKDGNGKYYFAESLYRSAPYFDIQVEGINLLNSKF